MPEGTRKSINDKIITLAEASERISRMAPQRVVLAGGCYDILHFGHLEFLLKSREAGDLLVVALESDEFVRRHKQREPFHTQQQRAQLLAALECVDMVIDLPYMKGNEDYLNLVKAVMPSVITVTEGDPKYEYKKQHADSVGAEVRTVCSLQKTFSTSRILQYANILRD